MAKIIIDHLDGEVTNDIYEWANQFNSDNLPEDMKREIASRVEKTDISVERIDSVKGQKHG